MDLATSIIYTSISFAAALYGLSIYLWMRERVKVASNYPNGKHALAIGTRDTALRLLLMTAVSVVIGSLVTVRDALDYVAGEAEPFSLVSFFLRLLFIVMVLLVMDALRIKKRTYTRTGGR